MQRTDDFAVLIEELYERALPQGYLGLITAQIQDGLERVLRQESVEGHGHGRNRRVRRRGGGSGVGELIQSPTTADGDGFLGTVGSLLQAGGQYLGEQSVFSRPSRVSTADHSVGHRRSTPRSSDADLPPQQALTGERFEVSPGRLDGPLQLAGHLVDAHRRTMTAQ